MTEQTPEQPALTEADYDIDIAVLLQVMGIEPGTVKDGSPKVEFVGGKAVLSYEVMRAVPARTLAVAMMAGAGMLPQQQAPETPEGEQDASVTKLPIDPDRPTRKGRRTAEKNAVGAAKRAVAKKAAPKAAK